MKFTQLVAHLAGEGDNGLGTNNSRNLVKTHENLLSRQNGMNHKHLRPLELYCITGALTNYIHKSVL